MAKSRSGGGRAKTPATPQSGWSALTWDDLTQWAGSRSVARGRSYQRGGRVKNLRVSPDGELLATVVGTLRYATTVALESGTDGPALNSSCTCPVGSSGCKHAVAVVADYLAALVDSREVPSASDDDPRWGELENPPDYGDDGYGYGDDEPWDDGNDEEDEGDDEEEPTPAPRRNKRGAKRSPAGEADQDTRIEQQIRGMSQAELADLAWSLVRRVPEVHREFRERLALQSGNIGQLLAEARREIRTVTAEPAWRNHWDGEGFTPDYSRIRNRFERLLELGHADEVVSLGREFIREGLRQVGESNDEGETADQFRECVPVVFRALLRSKLTVPERLLFAIDAELADDYDAIGEAAGAVLDAPAKPADWSAVADSLLGRLKAPPGRTHGDSDGFMRDYARDRLTDWAARALDRAGRDAEVAALLEAEARTTKSYQRLVAYLLEHGRAADAERWAREGTTATREKWPGIASHLADTLRQLAEKRKQWDVVAAHAAHAFFDRPSAHDFNELVKAAKKAGHEEAVRDAALSFLETGNGPFRVFTPKAPAAARGKPKGGRKPTAEPPAPTTPVLQVDAKWPLPVPDYLNPLARPRNAYDPGPRPHLNVLLELAIAAKQPDEVLRWYERMRAEPRRMGYEYDGARGYADRVAAAVAETHPEQAVEVYRAGLDAALPHADPAHYESATGYLRKLRPLFAQLGRSAEWTALLASVREKYARRRLFMELLDTLEGKTIVQSARKGKK